MSTDVTSAGKAQSVDPVLPRLKRERNVRDCDLIVFGNILNSVDDKLTKVIVPRGFSVRVAGVVEVGDLIEEANDLGALGIFDERIAELIERLLQCVLGSL